MISGPAAGDSYRFEWLTRALSDARALGLIQVDGVEAVVRSVFGA